MLGYLKFWFKSGNEHGLHSPFVYSLLTKGFYAKNTQWDKMSKKDQFIPRLIAYFQPQNIAIVGQTKDACFENYTAIKKQSFDVNQKTDFVFCSSLNHIDVVTIEEIVQTMHNDSVLIIDKRKKNQLTDQMWQQLINHSKITATIDFYYFGLAFIREEQLKQHFTLRL